MPEIKVVTIQAGEDVLRALTQLLGADVASAVAKAVGQAVPAAAPVEEETPVPEYSLGEVLSEENTDTFFKRVYAVPDLGYPSVRVTGEGVAVSFEDVNGEEFNDTIAIPGAFDEVTAEFNEDDETLTVRLFKLPAGGKLVRVEGWASEVDYDDDVDYDEDTEEEQSY